MERKALILGATSAISQAFARKLVSEGWGLTLVGRNSEQLEIIQSDLNARTDAECELRQLDFCELERHESFFEQLFIADNQYELVFICYGIMCEQEVTATDFELAKGEIESNYLSVVSLLTHLTKHFENSGKGTIAVVSSVAGDRGRQTNYVYGSAKAGLSCYLSGLRARMASKGVHVATIKPGFVDTPMTADMKKGLLFSTPEKVAGAIDKALKRKRNVVYVPWFWFWIMLIIKHIPEVIFKRLRF